MRLIDADALLQHQTEADRMGAMLVVGKGFIMDAPTITPQPNPETGLAPCGCGMPSVCVAETTIMHDGKKRVKYFIKCPKNHVHTDRFDTELQAKNYWHRAMGCPIK